MLGGVRLRSGKVEVGVDKVKGRQKHRNKRIAIGRRRTRNVSQSHSAAHTQRRNKQS
jgi:hypothetical protein